MLQSPQKVRKTINKVDLIKKKALHVNISTAKLKIQMENGKMKKKQIICYSSQSSSFSYKRLLETCMKKIRNLRKYEQSVYEMDISQ